MVVVPEDRISNLPLKVTQRILQFLPITDAIRTSVLSTCWRHKWLSLPDLILDESFTTAVQRLTERCFARSRVPDKARVGGYSYALNRILNEHVGPLHKFVLEIPSWFPEYIPIEQWLTFVSSKSVKEFTLIQKHHCRRELGRPFWSMDLTNLTHLELVNFSLRLLPSTFPGLPHLISLRLVDASLIEKMELLISSCTQLEKIYVDTDESNQSLVIKAPNLQQLVLKGQLFDVILEGTTKIDTITVDIPWLLYDRASCAEFLSCLSFAENINLEGSFWQEFRGFDWVVVPSKMQRLKTLTILRADLRDRATMSLILQLVQGSPQLQSLVIENISVSDINEEYDYDYYGMEEDFVTANHPVFEGFGSLHRLKYVRVAWEFESIDVSDAALELIRLILLNSPVLESMTSEAKHKKRADNRYQDEEEIKTDDDDDNGDVDDYGDYDREEAAATVRRRDMTVRGLDIAKKLLGYPRASYAKIIFKN